MPSQTDNLNLYLPDAGQSGIAAQLNTNWTTLDARFDEASGHTHDGSEGEGPKIPVTSLSTTGTASSSTYLRGDGQWATGTGSGTGITDHGDLTGLGDDDHPQYVNQARGDARYVQRGNNLSDLANTALARTNLGAAAATHQHAAADITSGTVATARLGSGTANATTYLRGDQTWATVAGGGGASTLDDLTDVLIVSPTDGQLLRYNATAARWENATVTTGGTTDEQIDDRVNALIVAGTGISKVYDDTANTLTLAATGGGGSAPDPVTTYTDADDFVTGGTTTGQVGALGWGFNQGSISYIDGEANHPGILRRATGTTANQICPLYPHSPSQREIIPADTFSLVYILRLSRAADIGARIGLLRNPDSNPPTDGIYLEKLGTDSTWMYVTRAAGVETRVSSGLTVGTDWIKCRIRRINGTTVGFTLNALAEQPMTATIPTAACSPCLHVFTTTTAGTGLEVDLITISVSGLTR